MDVTQAFQIFSVMEVSEGIDLEMLLKDFTEKVATDHKATCKGINAGSLVVLCNGRKLGNPDRALKQLGVKEGNKLVVTNIGVIMKDNVGHALRSMGYAVTETQMEDFSERAEMGADLTMMNAFISEIQAEPIDSSNIDDMEEVLAKEGHYKTATIEKIFKALPETDLTPDEVRRPRPFPAPRPPASAQRRAPCGQMAIIMKAADPSGSGQIPKDFFRNMID